MTAQGPEEREDKHGRAGERYFREGHFLEALAEFQAALGIARGRGDRSAVGVWVAKCGTAHLAAGEHSQARECLERAMTLKSELTKEEVHMRRTLAEACFEQGDAEAVRQSLVDALDIAREQGYRRAEAGILGYLGVSYSIDGDSQTALRHCQSALRIAEEVNDQTQIGIITGNIGDNYLGLNDYERAIEEFEKAIRVVREVGDTLNEERWQAGLEAARRGLELEKNPIEQASHDYQVAMQASQKQVSHGTSLELWLRAARTCRAARKYLYCGDSLAMAAKILSETRRFQEADRHWDEAADAFRIVSDQRRLGMVGINRSISLRERGELKRAFDVLADAVEQLRSADARAELAQALSLLAGISSEAERSLELLKEVAQIYRDLEDHSELAKILIRQAVFADEREPLLRESVAFARKAQDFETVYLATLHLAKHLANQARLEDAIAELEALKMQVEKQASSKLNREYLLLLGQLLDKHQDDNRALAVWYELLEAAERDKDLRSAIQALQGICSHYASQMGMIRNRMRLQLRRTEADEERHQRSLLPDSVPYKVVTKVDAAQMLRCLIEACPRAAPRSPAADRPMANPELALAESRATLMHKTIYLRASEFNQVFFQCMVFNFEHALLHSDHDRAASFVELARVIAGVQIQALRVSSTLGQQLLEEDQTEIIHVEPGARFNPVGKKDSHNARAAEVLYREAVGYIAIGRCKEAYQRLQNVLELLEHLGRDKTDCLGRLAYCALEVADLAAASRYASQAAAAYRERGDSHSEIKAILILGGAQQERREFGTAIRTYEAALAAAQSRGFHDLAAASMSDLGMVYAKQGVSDEAVRWCEKALTLLRQNSTPSSLVSTLSTLASLKRNIGELEASTEFMNEALKIVEATGDDRRKAMLLNNVGTYAIHDGRSADAEAVLYQAHEFAGKTDNKPLQLRVLQNLAVALRNCGKWDAHEETLAAIEQLCRDMGTPGRIAEPLMLRLDTAMLRGKNDDVIALGTQLLHNFADGLPLASVISILTNLYTCKLATGNNNDAACLADRLRELVTAAIPDSADSDLDLFVVSCRALAKLATHGHANENEVLLLLERCLALCQIRGRTQQMATLSGERGLILHRQGRFNESLEAHRHAVKLLANTKEQYGRAGALAHLGAALREVGQLQDSLLTYQEALGAIGQIQAEVLRARILLSTASVAYDLGCHEDGESLSQQAIELAIRSGDRATQARGAVFLASRLIENQNAASAEEELRAVLGDHALPSDVRAEACALCSLALRAQHRYEEAKELIDQSITLGGTSTIEQATRLYYAGHIYAENGQLQTALEKLDCAIGSIGDSVSAITIGIHELRGDIYLQRPDLMAAATEYEHAVRGLSLLRKHMVHERHRLQGLTCFAKIPQKLTQVLLKLERFTEAFAILESAKSRSLVDRLGLGVPPLPGGVSQKLREQEQQLLGEMLQLEQRIAAANSANQRMRLNNDYRRALASYEQLLENIAGSAPDFAESRRGATITFDEVRGILT